MFVTTRDMLKREIPSIPAGTAKKNIVRLGNCDLGLCIYSALLFKAKVSGTAIRTLACVELGIDEHKNPKYNSLDDHKLCRKLAWASCLGTVMPHGKHQGRRPRYQQICLSGHSPGKKNPRPSLRQAHRRMVPARVPFGWLHTESYQNRSRF